MKRPNSLTNRFNKLLFTIQKNLRSIFSEIVKYMYFLEYFWKKIYRNVLRNIKVFHVGHYKNKEFN